LRMSPARVAVANRGYGFGRNFTQHGAPTAMLWGDSSVPGPFHCAVRTVSPSWLAIKTHWPVGSTLKLRGVLISRPAAEVMCPWAVVPSRLMANSATLS